MMKLEIDDGYYVTKRNTSHEIEEIIGDKFSVLNDGFVRVIDYMGNDEAVVQAARVSYGKGTKSVSDDRSLINYLMRHRHTSPFEMCEIKLHVRVPMDTWRQWIRHRMANVNEYSTRYSEAIDSMQRTKPDEWRKQSSDNKQGSNGYLSEEEGVYFSMDEQTLQEQAVKVYKARLQAGIAREQARKDLPLSTYTEAYWKIDLRNLLHFLSLRMDNHAQLEIRQYADIIGKEIVAKWCPMVWEAFTKYQLNSVTLTQSDIDALNEYYDGQIESLDELEYHFSSKSEFREFKQKLENMSLGREFK
jgi:thymidylate synthase (FAD)